MKKIGKVIWYALVAVAMIGLTIFACYYQYCKYKFFLSN